VRGLKPTALASTAVLWCIGLRCLRPARSRFQAKLVQDARRGGEGNSGLNHERVLLIYFFVNGISSFNRDPEEYALPCSPLLCSLDTASSILGFTVNSRMG
jgi:hypothetical protein